MQLFHLLSLVLCLLLLWAPAGAADRPPNIILIFTDDLGYNDLGCYGAPQIKTPRLDRMATEGIRFTDFYVAASVCSPSRAALLTGCYPQRISMAEFTQQKGPKTPTARVLYPGSPTGLHPDELTLPEVLRSAGYATACVGKWHLGDAEPFLPLNHGFDSYFGVPYSNDMKPLVLMRGNEVVETEVDQDPLVQRYTEETIKLIREHKDRPFFIYLAHAMPHTPLHVSKEFRGRSAGGLYGDVVEELDHSTGRILDALQELGLDEQTLVIFTSDNGPWHLRGEHGGSATPLRGAKGTTYEGGMRVPCIMRWPGKIPGGSVCGELATAMDLLPTFARWAGQSLPQDRTIDGHDISDLVFARPGAKTPYDYFYYYAGNRLNAVRSGPWKLKLETTLQEETEYGQYEQPDAVIPERLYNLALDPGEQKSVLRDRPKIHQRLLEAAERARQDMGDARKGIVGANVRPIGSIEQ